MVVSCRHYGHFASRMIEVKGSATILIVSAPGSSSKAICNHQVPAKVLDFDE
jgi:hypothetical protein